MSDDIFNYYESAYYDDPYVMRAKEKASQNEELLSAEVMVRAMRLVATKLVAGLTTHEDIKHKIVKQLLRDQLAFMISSYRREEKLPLQYIWVSKQADCLETVIKSYLISQHDVGLTDDLHNEIRTFVKEIQINSDLQIVYDRVAKIQAYLHNKIDGIQGPGAHRKIKTLPIKHLLSACRLHLNLADFKTRDLESLVHLITESENAAILDHNNPRNIALRPVRLLPGATFIPTYRIRHLRSLLYYAEPKISRKIRHISHLGHDETISEFRKTVIKIYISPNYLEGHRCHWADRDRCL